MKRKKKRKKPNEFYAKLKEQFPDLTEDAIRMRLKRGSDEKIARAAAELRIELDNKAVEIKKLLKQT